MLGIFRKKENKALNFMQRFMWVSSVNAVYGSSFLCFQKGVLKLQRHQKVKKYDKSFVDNFYTEDC